jgi:hypothetical protein
MACHSVANPLRFRCQAFGHFARLGSNMSRQTLGDEVRKYAVSSMNTRRLVRSTKGCWH